MASGAQSPPPSARELAELSALADGSLDPARRATVEARIAASPELTARYERERMVVRALHEARARDRAPAPLRTRIEAARPSRAAWAGQRFGYAGAVACALALVGLVLAFALPSGAPGGPSISDAAALANRGPVQAAPAANPANPAHLEASVGHVSFPNWAAPLGWRAVGTRVDRLAGRRAVTVYYQWRDQEVAYTIVAAPALPEPYASSTWRHGTEFRTLTINGRLVVTWRNSGDTCVLSGTSVSAAVLQTLAAW